MAGGHPKSNLSVCIFQFGDQISISVTVKGIRYHESDFLLMPETGQDDP